MKTRLFCYNPFCKYNILITEKTLFLNIPKWIQISYPNNITNTVSNSLVNYEKITRHYFMDESLKKFTYFCSYCKEHLDVMSLIKFAMSHEIYKNTEFWESDLLLRKNLL